MCVSTRPRSIVFVFVAVAALAAVPSACATGERDAVSEGASGAGGAPTVTVPPPALPVDPAREAGVDAAIDAPPPKVDATAAAPCTMTVLAGGASTLFASTWTSTSSTWSTPFTAARSVTSTPALVWDGSAYLGVVRSSANAMAWLRGGKGSWSVPSPLATATTQGAPALVTTGGVSHVVYWGENAKFYHGTFNGSAWDAANDLVGGASAPSFGQSPPAATTLGGAFTIAQAGTDANVYVQRWSSSWEPALALSGATFARQTTSPRIAVLPNGDTLVVFPHTDGLLLHAVRGAADWQAARALYDEPGKTAASTPGALSLAASAKGGAVVAFRGADGTAYASIYPPSASAAAPAPVASPWSEPAAIPTSSSIASVPELATGVCGDEVVLAYVTSSGGVETMSRRAGVWSAPSGVPGIASATFATIATER